MTREELKNCSGFSVQINLDGKDILGTLDLSNPDMGLIIPDSTVWKNISGYPLTDEDVGLLRHYGSQNLFSTITLRTC